MRIRNKHRIKCGREQVWDMLMDINFLSTAIPGGKKFSKRGRNKLRGTLWVKVGFFKVKLKATLTLEKIDKPRSFRLLVYAKGTGTSIRGHLDLKLARSGECETDLSYESDIKFKNIPGVVQGEIKNKLKKALNGLCTRVEKECKQKELHSGDNDCESSAREVSTIPSQFEQEAAEIVSKFQKQTEKLLAELINTNCTQLKADLTELISRIEKQSQEDDKHAH